MKRPTALHPFLFVLLPVLTSYSERVDQTLFAEVWTAAAIALAFAALLVLATLLLVRSLDRAALWVTSAVLVFSYYGAAPHWMGHWRLGAFELCMNWFFLPPCMAFLGWAGYRLARTSRQFGRVTKILNLVAAFALLVPGARLGVAGASRVARSLSRRPAALPKATRQSASLPDIYYIVLDRYGDADTLKDNYSYDNQEFYDYLKRKDFYVAGRGRSNYLNRVSSLASSLNMEFLDALPERYGKNLSDWEPLYSLIRDHKIGRFLQSMGYTYVHVGSWWWPTRSNPNAGMNIHYLAPPLTLMDLVYDNVFGPFHHDLGRSVSILNSRFQQWKQLNYEFERLSQLPRMRGPMLVFAHILTPDDPVFRRDGSFVTAEEIFSLRYEEIYRNQLEALNQKLERLVDHLKSDSSAPPIIVLQSGEGPSPFRYRDEEEDFLWERATVSEIREKTGILNAYHLPGVDAKDLYPGITPVNTFRLILKVYFGANLELLPDRVFAQVSDRAPYSFFDITDRIGGVGKPEQ